MTMEAPANVPIVQEKLRQRWGLWLFIPLALAFIVLIVVSTKWRQTLKMERITVAGATILPVKDLVTLAGIQPRAAMSGIDLYEVRKRLLQQPFVKSASVNRVYPGTVSIRIVERKPIGLLSGGQLRYVDADGVVLPYVNSAVTVDLPAISGIDGVQDAEVGKVCEQKDLGEAIRILRTAQAVDSTVYHFISEVDMQEGRDVILYSADVVIQIYLGRGDVAKKLVMLQSFWATFAKTADLDKVKSIDLRYEDQVVVKWNQMPATGAPKAAL